MAFLGSNLILKDNLVDISLQKPLEAISKYSDSLRRPLESLEPEIYPFDGKNKPSLSENSI